MSPLRHLNAAVAANTGMLQSLLPQQRVALQVDQEGAAVHATAEGGRRLMGVDLVEEVVLEELPQLRSQGELEARRPSVATSDREAEAHWQQRC